MCLHFQAPEVVNYEPLTCATDMWNIGVLIYVLVSGHTPFGGATKLDTQSNITHCILDFPTDLFEKISENCIDLIQKLIVRVSKQRMTAHQSLEHPWICSNHDQQVNEQIEHLAEQIHEQNFD